MATTQQGRMMAIATPLGEDYLLINKLTANEAISELYKLEVELLHEENQPGSIPTIVDSKKILGQSVAIELLQSDNTKRYFHGIVNRFSQGNRDGRFSYYYATVVPSAWILTQKSNSRIFQQKSVPDILKVIFEGIQVRWQLNGRTYEPRNYCVQYRETDFAFASRLMEEEGIYYYFEHTDNAYHMIFADTPQSHQDCPSKSKIPFFLKVSPDEDFVSSIGTWLADYQYQTGKVTLRDFNFQTPSKNYEFYQSVLTPIAGSDKLEIYDYPGGYARKFDGINIDGGEQAAELSKIDPDKELTIRNRVQALDAQYNTFAGVADCASMTAGHRFELTEHPINTFNQKYTLTSVTHEIEQTPDYISEEEVSDAYRNRFNCIPHITPFRPQLTTPKPMVQGSQTALVVGPAGEEIFTDKYGRVKVQFHWDRYGQADSSSSCWVRVAQGWAGKRWGMVFLPRVGMEVIVDFLEGDPDQPIITGCVYNAETMPPYTLPDEKTKSTIKTDSSKGGGGFNELRFEDKKGSEQIFIHGEKNLDVRIKNDSLEYLGKDKHLIVKNDQYEKVEKDKHQQIGGDRNEKIGGSLSLNVATDIDEKAGAKYAVDAGTEIHLKSGTSLTLETGTNLTLKVGGNFININSGGIFIKGTMVMLNSGGAAGSGSGASPDAPKDPKEADKAEPGQRPPAPKPNPPPPKPNTYSPAAIALVRAAQTGKAFCEICSREATQPQPAPVETKVVPVEPQPVPAETKKEQKKTFIEIMLVDMEGKPVPGERYRITLPSGEIQEGNLNEHGQAGYYQIEPGNCKITFPDLDKDAWE